MNTTKIIKRLTLGIVLFVLLLLVVAFALTLIFKDDIKKEADQQIAQVINAEVIYDPDNFTLSLFKDFPNMTVVVQDVGIYNRDPFQGVPLFLVEQLAVEIDIIDLIFGDQIQIKGIALVAPKIHVIVLEDGRANYDITFPSDSITAEGAEESGSFSFAIDEWKISRATLLYEDHSMPFSMTIKGMTQEGKGNFNEAEFDLTTNTQADSLSLTYDNIEYISNKKVSLQALINIAEDYTQYTILQNQTKINDFMLSLTGRLKMNEDDMDMDFSFSSPENSFKNLLSLVPGMYQQGFENITAGGSITFNGAIKGQMTDTELPSFTTQLQVRNAHFKYPTSPLDIHQVNLSMEVDHQQGALDNTRIDITESHLELGTNSVDARLLIENLKDYKMKADISSTVNLAELTQIFPMGDSLQLKGTCVFEAHAQGVYDSTKNQIPTIDASMSLVDGYVKTGHFPLPVENIKMKVKVNNTSGRMDQTNITLSTFSMLLNEDQFSASGTVRNLNDYTWDLALNGNIDLEKITKIFPQEGMTLAGKIQANFSTKGKYSNVTAKRYDRLSNHGYIRLEKFAFSSVDLPYELTISQSELTFSPANIQLKNTAGTIGQSDFFLQGKVTNYMGYLFTNESIRGNLSFKSNTLNLNEFMPEEETPSSTSTEMATTVIPVPARVNFTFQSDIQKVHFMDYIISKASGQIVVKNEVAHLNGLTFTLLDGEFLMKGSYQAKDKRLPKYDFSLNISDLDINKAYSSFSMVKKYAPIAGETRGKFSSDLTLKGILKQDMTPDLEKVTGKGVINIAEAQIESSKLTSAITAKLKWADQMSLKDVQMNFTLADGEIHLEPFQTTLGQYNTTVQGSTSLSGQIDYAIQTSVPADQLGGQFQQLLSQYANTNQIPVTIGIGGSYTQPKVKLTLRQDKNATKKVIEEKVKEKATEEIKKLFKDKIKENKKVSEGIKKGLEGVFKSKKKKNNFP